MKRLPILLWLCCATLPVLAQPLMPGGRVPLAVIPDSIPGCTRPAVSLGGTWEINLDPGAEPWKTRRGEWQNILVPGEPAMQGFAVVNDREFFYRTRLAIPEAAAGKRILIRFNGVYSFARVFVNGKFVRDHHGGFTSWDADITAFVKPGSEAILHVGVTDRADDISYASGYAHHPIGGILRDVQMIIVPKDYLNRLYVTTLPVNEYSDWTLGVEVAKFVGSPEGEVRFSLTDAGGNPVPAGSETLVFDDAGTARYSRVIKNPALWNQEVPILYTLRAELIKNGRIEEIITQPVGFRDVRVSGRQLLVNGDPVKLRGACRHDVHPTLGRSTTRYYDSLDVVLAREANVNFIRTSHYPPSPDFLEFADRYGLYVQVETAICFVNDWRTGVYKSLGETSNDTAFTDRYLGQLSEMIDRHRSHPSVIMWSIGNESNYGINFQKEYDYVKRVDTTRPVSWTWPATAIREGKRCFDIAVAHYPSYNGSESENFGLTYRNMEHDSLPLLSDEWAHVACYCNTLMDLDPNVQDFWGRSLDTMWSVRFDKPGNLGGAIWGMTDELFHLPDSVTGYGPWGFIDVSHNRKTEFWNVRKAYSPIRLLSTRWTKRDGVNQAEITLKNRFNHLSLSQLRMIVTEGDQTVEIPLPDVKPHGEVTLKLESSDPYLSSLLLRFIGPDGQVVDEERISRGRGIPAMQMMANDGLVVTPAGRETELSGSGFRIILDSQTGQILSATAEGEPVLRGGARIVVNRPVEPGAFKESAGEFTREYRVDQAEINTSQPDRVIVESRGFAGRYPVRMKTTYDYTGMIVTEYEVDSLPAHTWHVGMALPLAAAADEIRWDRIGYWSTYPEGHPSADSGVSKRSDSDWRAFTGTKENILSFRILAQGKEVGSVTSTGRQSARVFRQPDGAQELQVLEKVDYWTLSWGNYQGTPNRSGKMAGVVLFRLGN